MEQPATVVSNASKIGDFESDGDFDFVFVEKDFEGQSTEDEDDDADSYDYCEDASLISNSTGQDNGDEVYLLSDSIDNVITTSPTTGLKDSALTVPLVLLKDLDEAHEAAKLTQITDLEGVHDLVTTCSDDEHGIEADVEAEEEAERKDTFSSPSPQNSVPELPEKEKMEEMEQSDLPKAPSTPNNNNGNDSTSVKNSPSETLCIMEHEKNVATINEKSAPINRAIIFFPGVEPKRIASSSETKAATPYFLLTNVPQKEKATTTKEEKQSNGDKNTTSTNKKTTGVVSISRASNKKRRKKLKLLKKAQAAEKFQQQAALAKLASSPSQGKVVKNYLKHSKPSRCSSKKVANIAVSCVKESMSSYREELRQQQGQ